MKCKDPFKFFKAAKTTGKYCVTRMKSEGPITEESVSENVSENEKCNIEYALKATGQGRYHTFLLFVCGCCMMTVSIENTNIGFALPYVRCEMQSTPTQQGLLTSIGFIGTIISLQIWGFLADNFAGRRRILLISMAGTFISSTLFVLCFNIETLIVVRFFIGLFIAGIQAATYSYISEFHSSETRTKACSFVVVFATTSQILLPLLAWAIIPMQWNWKIFDVKVMPWRIFLFLSSLLNGINFFCLYRLPESPKYLLSTNRKEETLNILRKMYAINTGFNEQLYPVKDLTLETTAITLSDVNGFYGFLKLIKIQTSPLFKPPNAEIFYKLCFLSLSLNLVGNGLLVWFPYLLTLMEAHRNDVLCNIVRNNPISLVNSNSAWIPVDSFVDYVFAMYDCENNSNTLIFKILGILGIVHFATLLFISTFINKINRRNLFTIWTVVCAAPILPILFVAEFYTVSISFIIFLSAGILNSLLAANSVCEFPGNIRAMATCLIMVCGRIGAFAGSNVIGNFLTNYCTTIFGVSGAMVLTSAIVCGFLKLSRPTNSNNTESSLKSREMKCEICVSKTNT